MKEFASTRDGIITDYHSVLDVMKHAAKSMSDLNENHWIIIKKSQL